jgi:hypothetical protein
MLRHRFSELDGGIAKIAKDGVIDKSESTTSLAYSFAAISRTLTTISETEDVSSIERCSSSFRLLFDSAVMMF